MVRLGPDSPGYKIADIGDVDRLGAHILDRLPTSTREFLAKAAAAAPEKPLDSVSGVDDAIQTDNLLVRWLLPFVKWDERAYIPDSAKDAIIAARQQFQNKIDELVREAEFVGGKVGPEAQDEIEYAIFEFVHASGLLRIL